MDSTPTSLPDPWTLRQRWFIAGLLLLFVALSIQYTFKVLDQSKEPSNGQSAFIRWRKQLLEMDEENIYERYNYPNPPIMAMLLKPLVELPPLAGALTWFYLKVAMTLVSFYWLFRLVEHGGVSFPLWGRVLTVLLSLRPIMSDLHHGNINLFILFLIMAALFAFYRGRPFTSGLLFGLAIACKVTPALFLPYFLWKRAWRAVAGCLVGMFLFFGPVPALFLGWQDNAEQFTSWTKNMVVPYLVNGVVTTTHENQSLPGLIHRLTTHQPSFVFYNQDKTVVVGTLYHNLLDLDPRLVSLIVKICMLLFALLVVWSCRTPLTERGGWRLAAEFSIVVLGMLLFSERTWKHHCVTFMLPFGVLSYALTVFRLGPRLRAALIGALGLTMLLMATTSTSLLDLFDRWECAKLAQVYGAFVWAYLILLVSLVVLLRYRRTEDETLPAAAPKEQTFTSRTTLEIIHQRITCCSDVIAERLGR